MKIISWDLGYYNGLTEMTELNNKIFLNQLITFCGFKKLLLNLISIINYSPFCFTGIPITLCKKLTNKVIRIITLITFVKQALHIPIVLCDETLTSKCWKGKNKHIISAIKIFMRLFTKLEYLI